MSKPVFEDLYAFSGRRNRQSYAIFTLGYLVVVFIAVLLFPGLLTGDLTPQEWVLVTILMLPVSIASWAVVAQRCRDFGRSGWLALLCAVPYVGWIFALVILFIPGNRGSNRYGRDPLA